MIVQVVQLGTMAEGNYSRHTVTLSVRPLRIGSRTSYSATTVSSKGRKSYPTIYQAMLPKN